ncbi:MAG: hypothetical protein GF344_04700 [Chitinivibrionales bacterium]|nr:hypothetical protein [Chitinivibrionales bacterium]
MIDEPDIVETLAPLVRTLDLLRVAWYIGGSVASSSYGTPRMTMNIDLVADIHAHQIHSFIEHVEHDFLVNRQAVAAAVRDRRSFNLIHKETILKVDIFVCQANLLAEEAMRRRRSEIMDSRQKIYFASSEDTVLAKLDWYRKGGEVSQKQWEDILGVLQMQRGNLDMAYLRCWSDRQGLLTLLDRALSQLPEDE